MTETAQLPLPPATRSPRTILNAQQIVKASEWMKANAEPVRCATNATLAAELTVVLGTKVTENNVVMLRDATGLVPRDPATVIDDKLDVIARALEFMLSSDAWCPGEQAEAARHREAVQKLLCGD